MASIERLPSGRYRVRWRTGGRGSSWRKSPTVGSRAEAVSMAGRIADEIAASRTPRAGVPESISILCTAWAAAQVADGRDADNTRRDLRRLATMLRRYGWADRVELDPADVDTARSLTRTAEGAAIRWSQRAGAILASALRWAVERRGASIPARTLVALRPGRPRFRPPRPLVGPAEVQRWHDRAGAISPDCLALVHCLARYGWRPITAARLRVADLDQVRAVVRVAVKGGDIIEHPLLPESVALLSGLAADRDPAAPLFLDPRSGAAFTPAGSSAIPQWWRDHIGGCGIYDVKRWAISHLLSVAPPHEVAKITGHRTPSVLFRYAQTTEERSRAVLAAAWSDPCAHAGHTMGTPSKPPRDDRPRRSRKSPAKQRKRTA